VSGYSQQMRDHPNSGTDATLGDKIPRGIRAMGVFLFFGATMASLAGVTLTRPGTSLDGIWALKPTLMNSLRHLGNQLEFPSFC